MKIRKSKYHQKSVKVVHCGALIWRKFSTNCDAHLAERFLKGRENNHLLKSLFKLSVIFMAFTASGCTLAVPEAGTDGNGDRLIGAFITSEYLDLYDMEGYLNDHAASLMNDPDSAKNAVRLAWVNRSMNLCIYSLIDIGIHYRGWDAARTAVFLRAFGINNASTAAEIYQYIVETPGNYLKYYWGYLNFLDLKTVCQKRLGDDFDLKEFHRRILDIGPVQFPVLEKYMK